MVSRWFWWAPLGLLVVGCALIGLRYGWVAATITETDVINRYAERYVDTHGGAAAMTDCVAFPADADPRVWIVVRCQPVSDDGAPVYDYYVNRRGGLEYGEGLPDVGVREPQT